MKTIILITFFIFWSVFVFAQSYYPLIETGKTWHVMESGSFGPTFTYTYKVEGDTLINQNLYRLLYRSNEEYPVNWMKHGYIREDENKKVYYSPFHEGDTAFNEPGLVYDFGAGINDTLLIHSFSYNNSNELEIIISGIDSVLIGDNYRRRLLFECEHFSNNFWIEGIGSNNGLIETGFYCYIVCPVIELLCVQQQGEIIYHHDYYEECYYVGIEDNNANQRRFDIYPNPADDFIY